MTRSDMAAYIQEKMKCTKVQSTLAAYYAVEFLLNAVASGERVELRGFGTFSTVERKERKSNLGFTVPSAKIVKFKESEALKRLLENNGVKQNE